MDTAAESKDPEVAEELLQYFIAEDRKDCFVAALYTCYTLLRPDVVYEIAWRHSLQDYAAPFMIQAMRQTLTRLETLEQANQERTVKDAEKEKQGNLKRAYWM
jgi:clathrin heavy chain